MKTTHYIVLIAALATLGAALLAFPTVIRALPGRYAYYLPEPLQAMRHNDHPMTLPTPEASPVQPTSPPTSTATPTPSPTPTPPDTETPLPSVTPSPLPPATSTPPAAITLEGIRHERQSWNNCGPTTLAMGLSYWSSDKTQSDIAPRLKPDPEDKHVGIHQMEEYAREQGLGTAIRVGGSLDQLKALLRAGFPVIVESWYVRDAQDQLGHYRLVAGYDDAQQHFHMYDSLYDPPTTMGYQELDELWRVFNRTYLVVYAPERWEDLAPILNLEKPPDPSKMPELVGPELDDAAMYEEALETARTELANPPASCVAYADCADQLTFSWFNIGTNLTALERYEEAAAAYDQARQAGLHYRMLWYQFGPYEAYYAAGRYDDVIDLANSTLNTAKNLEESYYWRGKARLAQGDREGARADFEAALRYHESWEPATIALTAMDNEA